MVVPASSQRKVFLTAAFTVALLVAQQVASKATRDALFLGLWDAKWLPWVMLAGAACSLLAAIFITAFMRRAGPVKVVPRVLGFSALLYFVQWFLIEPYRPYVAWTLYLHVSIFGATTLSGFWSVYGELFDPNTAKRLMGRVGAGATLGGILGALCTERLAVWGNVGTNLAFLGALHLIGSVAMSRLLKIGSVPFVRRPPTTDEAKVWKNHYLLYIGVLVGVTSAGAALIDFAFKTAASNNLQSEPALIRFFAVFYAGVALAGFLTQTLLSDGALRKLGIGGTLALLPGAVTLCSGVAAFLTQLPSLVALRGVSNVLQISTHRSAYELLYTPLAHDEKRASKTLIDIAFDRAGDAIGSAAILGILAFFPQFSERSSVLAAGALALVGLGLAWRLNRGYVGQLAQSLTSGVLDPSLVTVEDATTQRTIAETTLGLNRQQLLEEIEKLRLAEGRAKPLGHSQSETTERASHVAEIRQTQAAQVLLSEDPQAVEGLLRRQSVPTPLSGLVVNLLGRPRFEKAALEYLEKHANGLEGILHDVLLDPALELAVRRRIPRILRSSATRRSVHALLDGLSSDRFELRYRAGQALVYLHENHPQLFELKEHLIFELVQRELRGPAPNISQSDPPPESDASKSIETEASGWLNQALRRRLRHRLEHVFSLLSLVRPRAPLEASLQALYGDDPRLRGTAFEYLENVLPAELCAQLWPFLEAPQKAATRSTRPPSEVLDDLLKSSDSIAFDRSLLKPPGS